MRRNSSVDDGDVVYDEENPSLDRLMSLVQAPVASDGRKREEERRATVRMANRILAALIIPWRLHASQPVYTPQPSVSFTLFGLSLISFITRVREKRCERVRGMQIAF